MILFDIFSNNTTLSLTNQSFSNSSSDIHINDDNQSALPLSNTSPIIHNPLEQRKMIAIGRLIVAIFSIVMIIAVSLTVSFIKKQHLSPMITDKRVTTSTQTHVVSSEKPITLSELPNICKYIYNYSYDIANIFSFSLLSLCSS